MKFQNTFCSQCGEEFGPGDHGYSHCSNHRLPSSTTTTSERELMNNEIETTIETEDGVEQPVARAVAVRKGVIIVSVTNFQFSKPTISVKVKPALWKKKFKKASEANRKKAKG